MNIENVVLENCMTEISNERVTPRRELAKTSNGLVSTRTKVISSEKSREAYPNGEIVITHE